MLLGALVCLPFAAVGQEGGDAFERGRSALDAGRYAEAESYFETATKAEPGSVEAHFYLGLAASRAGHPLKARRAYERVAALDPDFPSIDTSLGISYYGSDDLERAEQHLERALVVDPADAAAQLYLGLVFLRRDAAAAALPHFRAATEDPDLAAAAWLQVGRAEARLGHQEEARSALERAIELDREGELSAEALALLGSLEGVEGIRSKPWALSGGVGFEYDDNLTVSEVDFTSGVSDVAGVFDFSGSYTFPQWREIEVEAGYDFYQSLYADVSALDLQSHNIGLAAWTDFRGFDPGVGYRYTNSSLGGDAFLQLHNLSVTVGRVLQPWWYLVLGWDLQGRVFADDAERDGVRNALVLDQFFTPRRWKASGALTWRLEGEDASGPEFDFLGNVLRLRVQRPFELWGHVIACELGYEFVARDYDNITPSIGEKRWDRRHTFGLTLRTPVVRHVMAILDYSHVNADSNLPSQRYNQNIFSLRAEAAF